jgi:hypothetical protein
MLPSIFPKVIIAKIKVEITNFLNKLKLAKKHLITGNTQERVRILSLIIVSVGIFLMTVFLNSKFKVAEEISQKENFQGEISSASTTRKVDTIAKSTNSDNNLMEPNSSKNQGIDKTNVWIANDYEPGEITSDMYEVTEGDTLWEIAEAKYGSGFFYNKIIEKNPDQIQKFPDGRIGLIQVGAVLKL